MLLPKILFLSKKAAIIRGLWIFLDRFCGLQAVKISDFFRRKVSVRASA